MQLYFIFFRRQFFYKNFHKKTTIHYFLKMFLGFNFNKILYILKRNGLPYYCLLKQVTPLHLGLLSHYIEKFYMPELYYRLQKERVLQKYLKYGFFKGIRMRQGMPLRGQRSRTNAQTSRKRIY